MVPEISIHCSRSIFGEGEASIKGIRVKSISDSFTLSYELQYKLGIKLKKGTSERTQPIPLPKTTTKYTKLFLRTQPTSRESLQWQEALGFFRWLTPVVYLTKFPKPGCASESLGVLSKNRYFRALPQIFNIRAPTEEARILLFLNTPKAAHPQNHMRNNWFNTWTFSWDQSGHLVGE